jgi:hypothetical protein
MQRVGFNRLMDLYVIRHLRISLKSAEKIQVSLKSDSNHGYLNMNTYAYIYDHISLNSAENEKTFRTKAVEKSKHEFYVQHSTTTTPPPKTVTFMG